MNKLVEYEIMDVISRNTMAKPDDATVLVMPKFINTNDTINSLYYLIETNDTMYLETYNLDIGFMLTYSLCKATINLTNYTNNYDIAIKILLTGDIINRCTIEGVENI